ncbi:cyclic pyranopterin monophosphate synthase MoaC [Geminocystis sp. NIES-3709]|uniref:cyclic pyranopterin monophosphate synthase MoaC n=1 Tax=Geminocystis sp. NIES-3709 TaxID=1617448 RepID=UPI0005FC8A57|nr:cyclic pyranopterin monophosphate synthase MoaC [Geminocystis sp. NIES-3709]BAQ63507.1 molybdenum cofactor biosynthesis protein MoaC [Geminocystis sp. NIES-3709]
MSNKLSHINSDGEANMVDVSSKSVTVREAIASGKIIMSKETFLKIQEGNCPKGDIVNTAKIAGIMAAKQTSMLIPLCHPLLLHKIVVNIIPDESLPGYYIEAIVKTKAETGVEMEALTAVSVTALTLYDMAKAIEKSLTITDIKLVSKTGGKSIINNG